MFWLLLFVLLNGPVSEIDYVDLSSKEVKNLEYRKFARKESCPRVVGGSVSSSVGDPRSNGGLRLEFLELDSPARWNQEVLATVRVVNVSQQSVRIPYSLEPQQFEEPDETGTYKYESARFGLSVGTSAADTVMLPVQVGLFGSTKNPGSLKELKPDEAVRFRVGTTLKCETRIDICEKMLRSNEIEVGTYFTEDSNTVKYAECSTATSSKAGLWVSSEKQTISIRR